MRDAIEAILIIALIAGYVYVRAKLWSRWYPGKNNFMWMGPKKFQTLFGDDPDKKP